MPALLVEIRVEELPASVVEPSLEHLRRGVDAGLSELRLAHASSVGIGTPRRLALFVADVEERQADREEVRRGPSVKAARKPDGSYTPAALGFARSAGVAVEALSEKDNYLHARVLVAGKPTLDLLPDLLAKAVRAIPFKKSMRWRGKEFLFSRPVRGLVALLGADVVPWEWAGLKAGRRVLGHPYLARDREGTLRGFDLARADVDAYREELLKLHVVVDAGERRKALERRRDELVVAAGIGLCNEPDLVAEIAQMLECPELVLGSFDERFLDLPADVIVAVLRHHQRYLPVWEKPGRLRNAFLASADRTPDVHGQIREGVQRVVRARLSDAAFFVKEDSRKPLRERVEALRGVMYLQGLGTLHDRTGRLRRLAEHFARRLYDEDVARVADRAASLSKADLVTEMVREMPELQGIMGCEYARTVDREAEEVCRAIAEQYLPRGSGDAVPETRPGVALALAERFDHVAGGFLKGFVPSGSKDPLGMRRASVGALTIVQARSLPLSLREAVEQAIAGYQGLVPVPEDLSGRILDFLRDRLVSDLRVGQSQRHDLVEAAMATSWDVYPDLVERVNVLQTLSEKPFWEDLVIAVERTHNITKGFDGPDTVREDLLREPEERRLHEVFREAEPRIAGLFRERRFAEGAEDYARTLGGPLHVFFDKVFVNVDDAALRANRLALLRRANRLFSTALADLSRVVRPKTA